jgi:hypothetical protein
MGQTRTIHAYKRFIPGTSKKNLRLTILLDGSILRSGTLPNDTPLILTEPEKQYGLETSTDFIAWSGHSNSIRDGDTLTVALPNTGDHRFIRAIQK